MTYKEILVNLFRYQSSWKGALIAMKNYVAFPSITKAANNQRYIYSSSNTKVVSINLCNLILTLNISTIRYCNCWGGGGGCIWINNLWRETNFFFPTQILDPNRGLRNTMPNYSNQLIVNTRNGTLNLHNWEWKKN